MRLRIVISCFAVCGFVAEPCLAEGAYVTRRIRLRGRLQYGCGLLTAPSPCLPFSPTMAPVETEYYDLVSVLSCDYHALLNARALT